MSQDDEVRVYLSDLLEHQSGCKTQGCRTCQAAHRVYDLLLSRLFFAVDYADAVKANAEGGRNKRSASGR